MLAVIALGAWQQANSADFDQATNIPEDYELSARTPLLSARRIPKTLRAPVSDARIADPINQTIANTTFPQMCISVRNGDRPLGNSKELAGGLVPASNQKLLTTYAALGILGPDFTFNTNVTATAPIEAGVIRGDMYLIGDGDPFLYTDDWLTQYPDVEGRSSTRLEALADAVAATGVTQVTGTIFGDESLYDDIRSGPWDPRLIDQKQSGPLSALSLNEGFTQWPAEFPGTARVRSSAPDPALNAASIFGQLLAERGVSVAGVPAVGVNLPGSVLIASIASPPLSATVTHINSYSSNIGAELVLKRLGFERFGTGTTEAGARAVTDYLAEVGIPMDDLQIFDGSGLAETNRITCQAITEVLASAGPNTPFGQSLSISGERGSLLLKFVDTVAEGNVLAKTGTLRNVRALSGYVLSSTTSDPDTYVSFSYILNDDMVIEGDVDVFLQTPLVTALTTYPAGPNVSAISPLDPTAN